MSTSTSVVMEERARHTNVYAYGLDAGRLMGSFVQSNVPGEPPQNQAIL